MHLFKFVHYQMNSSLGHHLITVKLFQTCMNFFLLLNTKEDILNNVGNQTVDGPH